MRTTQAARHVVSIVDQPSLPTKRTVGLGDETVVVRVHNRGVEDAVHIEQARLLVQLVLDL